MAQTPCLITPKFNTFVSINTQVLLTLKYNFIMAILWTYHCMILYSLSFKNSYQNKGIHRDEWPIVVVVSNVYMVAETKVWLNLDYIRRGLLNSIFVAFSLIQMFDDSDFFVTFWINIFVGASLWLYPVWIWNFNC